MKKSILRNYPVLVVALVLFAASGLGYAANTLYVWTNCPTPGSPYNDWTNAALTIQTAVDASSAGDTILVTNGVYDTGGATMYALTSRVCITKSITLRSFNNDPTNTIIKGKPDDTTGACGDNAVRCVYITNGLTTLIGFTLTNGYTMTNGDSKWDQSAGGIALAFRNAGMVVSNCVITGNKASSAAAIYAHNTGTVTHCVISGNESVGSCGYGGVYGNAKCILTNCTLEGNSGYYGGGAAGSLVLYNCMLRGNSTPDDGIGGGAGAYGCTLYNCDIISNVAYSYRGDNYNSGGAGLNGSTAYNCRIIANKETNQGYGGGVRRGTLYNCIISGNYCKSRGGGAYDATLYNCTINNNYGYLDSQKFSGGCQPLKAGIPL